MSQTVADCCTTCPFNGVNKGDHKRAAKDADNFFCEIRRFVILDPEWTYCNNHPLRNPLWRRHPRGPIWAAIQIGFDSKPLNPEIRIPAEAVPPQADGSYFRIPYYGLVRPRSGEAGICLICGDASEESIILLLERDKNFYCSAAHYFEWWLKTDPRAITYKTRTPLGQDAILERFKTIPQKLADGLSALADQDSAWVLDSLIEIDELLLEVRNGKIALMHDFLEKQDEEFEQPRFYDKLSPFLLQIQDGLAEAGELLRREELEYDALCDIITRIAKDIGGYVRRAWQN